MVDSGNGKFNLMTLCWGEGHGSAIHDHANAHCFMKVLEGRFKIVFLINMYFWFIFLFVGTLSEVRFSWPDDSKTDTSSTDNHEKQEESALQEIKRTELHKNEVAYINGWYFFSV